MRSDRLQRDPIYLHRNVCMIVCLNRLLWCMLGVPADFYSCFFFFCYSGVGGLLSASSPDQPKCCQFPWQFRWATAATALAYLAQTVLKLQAQKESFWMQTGGAWVGTCLCKWIEGQCSVLFFTSCAVSSLGEARAGKETLRAVSQFGPRGSRYERQL